VGNWLVERRLRGVGKRLKSLRAEIGVIDEQLAHLSADADDAEIRALVSDNPEAAPESRHAGEHAAAMRKHRAHVVATIAELEVKQDQLLDQLTGRPD
jgi:hypothetical protein